MSDEQPGGPRTASAASGATSAGPPGPAGGRMTRSRRQKVVGGVCGGLGRYFDLDPVIFRVPLVVLSLIGGVGFIAYGVAWLVLPFEGEDENEGRRMLSGRVEGPGLTALLFVVVGFGLLLSALPGRTQFFSVMLLGTLVGAAYWSRYRREVTRSAPEGVRPDPVTAQAVASAPPEVQAPPSPAGPSWWRGPGSGGGAESGYLWGPADAAVAAPPFPVDLHKRAEGEHTWRPPERREVAPPEPYREFWLGGLVLLTAVAAGVGAALFSWSSQPLGTALVYACTATLAVFGLGLVVSAFVGRLGAGTIVSVVLTGVLLVAASALPDNITTQWSDARWAPAAVSDVEPAYAMGSGSAWLDLSGLELPAGERLEVAVDAGAGQFRVLVPYDAVVEVRATVWLGGYEYREPWGRGGSTVQGGGFEVDWTGTYGPAPGTAPEGNGGTVELTLQMGVGQLVVDRADPPEVPSGEADGEADADAAAEDREPAGADAAADEQDQEADR